MSRAIGGGSGGSIHFKSRSSIDTSTARLRNVDASKLKLPGTQPLSSAWTLSNVTQQELETMRPHTDSEYLTLANGDVLPQVLCSVCGTGTDCSDHWSVALVDSSALGSSAYVSSSGVFYAVLAPTVTSAEATLTMTCPTSGLTHSIRITITTPFEYQSYDGSNNNLANPSYGAANSLLLRGSGTNAYNDSLSQPRTGPNPRFISNTVVKWAGGGSSPAHDSLTDMVWAWGQFLDHEIDLTPDSSGEALPVTAPVDDPDVPSGTISFTRSQYIPDTDGVRQQVNTISAFIDATNVYGASEERALSMRMLDGTGRLKTSYGGTLPPLNVGATMSNANANSSVAAESLFLCGDVRANENSLLTSMHTLFVLEHNRRCAELVDSDYTLQGNDELIFQTARRYVIALMQHITFDEFLPLLLGNTYTPPAYTAYNSAINAGIANEFSTAAYRFGHSLVSESLWLNSAGSTTETLADLFFTPAKTIQYGISAFLEGACAHNMQQVDTYIVESLRNMLFGAPDSPSGFLHDLATLNIQRGRDHGLPPYNDVREAYGLSRKSTFAEITADTTVQSALSTAYSADVDAIDLWVGCLAEDHVTGGNVGELAATIIAEQFTRLRNGDRFWYEKSGILSASLLAEIKATTLSDIIRRNSTATVQDTAFDNSV